ncbi:TIGR00341 family protein [Alteriqipengyuania lutimaris]|uniref:TIGR00341 family protein n=1 Tax=Alteriqipengyuania lutimaris TaxID=1538146 RepID=A0A395LJE1_9SPHN|nr:TIGR00341 family protein [Alteriqipengyuania lutimaris]MBB3033954.1 putative hydrophobic protein (TIGR00271 family) [Alteriqipengyuania lutimaris]RDS77093.1 TIGR00341 family protein [Alteriqipengyuania lutimaris]
MQTPSSAPENSGADVSDGSSDPAAVQRRRIGIDYVVTAFTRWWTIEVSGTVDQAAVIEKRRAECELTARYVLMVCMSAGIAILGMLLSSPAVVIGAMLIAPLMDPIMGVGFALAVGDFSWLRRAVRSLVLGVVLAILVCAALVVFSPIQIVTPEIASRTQPNLFDLMVAIFSAIAGAYAVIRGREGTIVGVAIATALMPPLAAVGYGLATLNMTVFSGALLLFVTNLTAIALTATAMARGYGFSTRLTEKQSQLQAFLIFGAFVALSVPLGLSLYQIGWESQAERTIRDNLVDVFEGKAQSVEPTVSFADDAISVTAEVYTDTLYSTAQVEDRARRSLEAALGRPVSVQIMQVESADAVEAQRLQLREASQREEATMARARTIAQRLAMVAGVPDDAVTVDRQQRRALVAVRPIEGAGLATYRELERRVDATEPEWDIRIEPPLRALPPIPFDEEGELTGEGRSALGLTIWAQRRVGIPIRLSGSEAQLDAVRDRLARTGVDYEEEVAGTATGAIETAWAIPED